MTESNTYYPHDRLWKKGLGEPKVAKEFLSLYLPSDVVKEIDLESIILEPVSFIDEKLKESSCDVLLKVKYQDKDAFIYTYAEHQSKPDYFISFRLLCYMTSIWKRFMEQNPEAKVLPAIFTIVMYNGKAKYTAPLSFLKLIDKHEIFTKFFEEGYSLIDLSKVDDEIIKQHKYLGPMELVLKYAYNKYILSKVEETIEIFKRLYESKLLSYFKSLIYYVSYRVDEKEYDNIGKILDNITKEEDLMTSLAQMWKNEGKLEGMQQGMQQGMQLGEQKGKQEGKLEGIVDTAKKMLKQGLDIKLIVSVTGLSEFEILKLKQLN